jgi:single-stranded-DNA-specific exonuclease
LESTDGGILSAVNKLRNELKISGLAARILVQRGFATPATARAFLKPDLTQLNDPFAMRDMDRAVSRLKQALDSKEPILLYGDYDVDGTTSIVILKKAIELLGGTVDWFVPHRLKDGYGMHHGVIERAAEQGIRLIISVDTGIRAAAVVERAKELGVDVIVTDHHLPEEALPPARAVLNPNRPDCGYPEKNLCGAGVALKLIQALLGAVGAAEERQRALLDSFLKLVAVATIADIVPLTGENRVIVRRGLAGLSVVKNQGLRALLLVAGFSEGDRPSAGQVAFRLAPRINAAGRMASAGDVIELFSTNDAVRAQVIAQQLDLLNRERQDEEASTVEQILEECAATEFDASLPALVFAQPGWHLGVVGIVASRLVERFSRPVFVLSEARDQGHYAGSGRSVPGFHLLEALESMPDLFKKFGGHRQAAGVTIHAERIDEFRERFTGFAKTKLRLEDLCPQYQVDAEADFEELTEQAVSEVFELAPFGAANPAPLLQANDVEVAGPPVLMSEGKHCRIPFRQGRRVLMMKAWGFGDRAVHFEPGNRFDVLFQVEEDAYARKQGYGTWSATLKDFRKS